MTYGKTGQQAQLLINITQGETHHEHIRRKLLDWQPKTHEEAWKKLKLVENLSTQAAIQQAQERWPDLFQTFLDNCPRAKG